MIGRGQCQYLRFFNSDRTRRGSVSYLGRGERRVGCVEVNPRGEDRAFIEIFFPKELFAGERQNQEMCVHVPCCLWIAKSIACSEIA